ncbi:MAG: hypothetical protein S4CHLAM102_13980 [Chlamydiia bacterium]|nr:hypothetical protein [Chlamydiia bacterium]
MFAQSNLTVIGSNQAAPAWPVPAVLNPEDKVVWNDQSSFGILPTEIMIKIFSNLSIQTMGMCRLVSKKWKVLVIKGGQEQVTQLMQQFATISFDPVPFRFPTPNTYFEVQENYTHALWIRANVYSTSSISEICRQFPKEIISRPAVSRYNLSVLLLLEGFVRASQLYQSVECRIQSMLALAILFGQLGHFLRGLGLINLVMPSPERDSAILALVEEAVLQRDFTFAVAALSYIQDPANYTIAHARVLYGQNPTLDEMTLKGYLPGLEDPMVLDRLKLQRIKYCLKGDAFPLATAYVHQIEAQDIQGEARVLCLQYLVDRNEVRTACQFTQEIVNQACLESAYKILFTHALEKNALDALLLILNTPGAGDIKSDWIRKVIQCVVAQLGVEGARGWIGQLDQNFVGLMAMGELAIIAYQQNETRHFNELVARCDQQTKTSIACGLRAWMQKMNVHDEAVQLRLSGRMRREIQIDRMKAIAKESVEEAIQFALSSKKPDIMCQQLILELPDRLSYGHLVYLLNQVKDPVHYTSTCETVVRILAERGCLEEAFSFLEPLRDRMTGMEDPVRRSELRDRYIMSASQVACHLLEQGQLASQIHKLDVKGDEVLMDEILMDASREMKHLNKHTEAFVLAEAVTDEEMRCETLFSVLEHFWSYRLEGQRWQEGIVEVAFEEDELLDE